MIQVRMLCTRCSKISAFTPGLTNEEAIDPVNCAYCGFFVGEIVYIPDKLKEKE